jgi:hypothetical protein
MRYAIKVGLAGGESFFILHHAGKVLEGELMNSNASCSGIY